MIRTLATNRFSPVAAHGAHGPAFSLVAVVRRIATWIAVARQRQHLAHLDADRLRDIGVSPEGAAREAGRPFWDAPEFWKREGHF